MHNGRGRDNAINHHRAIANTLSPPQPFSSFGSREPTTAQAIGTNRWYPKLTPFRSVTLIVGITLGVLKAVLTYQGSQFAPVAVEWICGTALFLLFYFLDALEKDIRLHDDSSIWFYDYDCLNLLWKPMRWIGINIPEYSTSEAPIWNPYSSKPIITNYRLLVSGTVLVLGMLKAVLAYLGKSDSATAVDWIFGVIIMTGLYILGLYECNTAKVLPSLFARNDSRLLLFMGYEGFILSFSIALIFMCSLGLRFATVTLPEMYSQGSEPLDLMTIDGITNLCGGVLLTFFQVMYGYFSLFPLFLAVLILLRYFEPSAVAPRVFLSFRRRYQLERFSPRSEVLIPTILEYGAFVLRSANHIILHTFFLFMAIFMSLLLISVSMRFFRSSFFASLYVLILGVGSAASTIPLVQSIIRPFNRVRRTGVWKGQGRELGFIF